MKKIKKWGALYLVLGLSAACVLSCNKQQSSTAGTGGQGSQGGGSASAARTDIRTLNYFDLTGPNSSDEVTVVWQVFDKANPDIRVIREDLYNEPFHNKVEAYAAAEQLPDVIYAWPSGRSTTLHTNHFLKDLRPLIQRDGLTSLYLPAALNPKAQGAGYVAILPQALTSTHVFYINNEVLKDAGLTPAKTYAELKAQVPVLRAKGYDTVIMANQDTWVMQSCLFSAIAGRFCGEDWEQKILSGETKFTDADFVAALNFIKTLYDDEVISKATLSTDYGSGIGQFATNKSAYYIDGDWRVGAFMTDKSTGQALISPDRQENFLLTVFPDIEGAKLNKSTSGTLGTGWGINAAIPPGSAREEAAWKLVKWLSGKEVQTYRLQAGGITTPTRTDIDMSSLNLEPMQKAAGNLGTQYTTTTSVVDSVFAGEVYTPLNDGLQELGMGSKTPRQVAEATQRAFDAWYARQPK